MSFVTNKLHKKFHLTTCIGDYSNVFRLFLIADEVISPYVALVCQRDP
jgi:hypothetical protein